VVDRVKQLLPQLTASLPASVEVATLTDRTVTIRASVKDVQFELMLAVCLVVMVIFPFSAHGCGHAHLEHRGAAFARRHLRLMYLRRVQREQLTLMRSPSPPGSSWTTRS